jgi:NADH-quinone oxidoreductase subunit G
MRVLANLLGLPGFDFETSQDVLAKATATAPVLSNATSAALRMAGEVAAPVVASIYQLDGVVRRAPSLQLTADARTAQEVAA